MNIETFLKPGDILNAGDDYMPKNIFKKIPRWIFLSSVHGDQKKIFGEKSIYKVHHTMIYFDPDHVFSVQLPSPKFIKLSEYADSLDSLYVYRYTGKELDKDDLSVMRSIAENIINQKKIYDIGQLFDILLGTMCGYPFKYNPIFDWGKKNKVCSVGCGVVYHRWRKWLALAKGIFLPRLFGQLNTQAWSKEFIEKFNKYGRWDIEALTPANFSNTETHFACEFKFIGKFKNNILV